MRWMRGRYYVFWAIDLVFGMRSQPMIMATHLRFFSLRSVWGFALMRESLYLLAQIKKPNKRHPTRRRLRRFTPMLATTGCGQNSDGLGRPQTSWPHRRNAPDTRRRCASPSPHNGAEYRHPIPNCRGPALYSSALGRSAEQRRPQANKTAECLSRASRGEFSAVRLRPEPRRVPMRSIGARQGAFCFGHFYLDKQIKAARASARNNRSGRTRELFSAPSPKHY